MTRFLALIAATCWWTTAGCNHDPPPDWEIYGKMMDKEAYQVSDLQRCADLSDTDLRGDCTVVVALALSTSMARPRGAFCTRAQEGIWREECHFLAAEQLRSQGKTGAAVKTCRKAGRFASNCALHLWQRAVATLTTRYNHQPLSQIEAPARRMYARWHKRVADFSDFETRFWKRLFRQVWSPPGAIDPQRCETLSADLHAPCFDGARLMLDQAIRAHLFEETWSRTFCASPPPPAGELRSLRGARRVLRRFSSHHSLDSLVSTFHESYCIAGVMPTPPEDPPPGPFPLNERPAGPHP